MSLFHNNALISASGRGSAAYQIQRSIRLNSADSAYLSRTPASAGNRKTWTWAGWVKRSKLGTLQYLLMVEAGFDDITDLYFDTSDKLNVYIDPPTAGITTVTTASVYRDSSAWYHIVVACDTTQSTSSNRVKVYVNGIEQTVTGAYPSQNVDTYVNSTTAHSIGIRLFNNTGALDAYLAECYLIDGQALTPTSFGEFDVNNVWQPKAYTGSYGTNGFQLKFADNSNNTATTLGKDTSGNNNNWTPTNLDVISYNVPAYSATNTATITNAFDGNLSTFWAAGSYQPNTTLTFTQAVTGTTFRLYISTGSQSGLFTINGTVPSTRPSGAARWYDYSSHINGSLSSITLGPPGTESLAAIEVNGFILRPVTTDSLVDTPTSYGADTGAGGQVRGNYCTWNPLKVSTNQTLLNGNLDTGGSSSALGAVGTIGVSSGKWYWELLISSGANADMVVGITSASSQPTDGYAGSTSTNGWSWRQSGSLLKSTSNITGSISTSFLNGDILQFALDADSGKVWLGKNNTWLNSGNPGAGLAQTITYATSEAPYFPNARAQGGLIVANFGARSFAYTAPSGFKALCTANLPTPTIANPATAMDVKLITANNSTQVITGLAFSPDLVWTKSRSNAYSHYLYDTVRGVQKPLLSNATNAETTIATSLTSFNSNGFTLGADDGANYGSGAGVAWAWDAGSSTVTNTQGSITSQVRANASAGFSIVTWTGDGAVEKTVGHGLGVAPKFYIVKRRNSTSDWAAFLTNIISGFNPQPYINLNGTAAAALASQPLPTSSVFYVQNVFDNINTATYVAYCFASVAGYSAFGSYTGNGSATDGPFVFLGFRPAVLILKNTIDYAGNWVIIDDKREGYNIDNDPLYPNLANAEGTTDLVDITSNGFKVRTSTGDVINSNTHTIIYAAWASSPFAYARAR